jgi:hypothetical protein
VVVIVGDSGVRVEYWIEGRREGRMEREWGGKD